jgi:hypothetical protein
MIMDFQLVIRQRLSEKILQAFVINVDMH